MEIAIARSWIAPTLEADAIALWWMGISLGRLLFDLVDDPCLDEQWRAIALANLRVLLLGEA